jgi:hypothetical protein
MMTQSQAAKTPEQKGKNKANGADSLDTPQASMSDVDKKTPDDAMSEVPEENAGRRQTSWITIP